MKFLFKYPTRGRPEQFAKTLTEWQINLSGKHDYTFLIAIDTDDDSMRQPILNARCDIICRPHKSKVEAVNSGIEHYDFDILVIVSDDMVPVVQDYEDVIALAMKRLYPDLDGALNFYDGLYSNPDCCTLTIMGRKLYEHFGYVYHPSYLGTHCDNEFTDDCKALGKITWLPDCIIKHDWQGVHDETSRRDERNFQTDKENYERRRAARQ